MAQTLGGIGASRLERSCGRPPDSIRFGPTAHGIERAEVYLSTHFFEPHRHDTYAIGITAAGVQTFHYRGSGRVCLPGQLHVLHPDEVHDGAAGTDEGFGYRILYIATELVRDALVGQALPFVADPVQKMTPVVSPIASVLADIDEPIDEIRGAEIAAAVADSLVSLSNRANHTISTTNIKAVELVRDFLTAHAREQTPASVLENIAGATASRSLAISAALSGRAPTATERCDDWSWPELRSRRESRWRRRLPGPASPTRAT